MATFNLAEVYGAGEAIKGARRRNKLADMDIQREEAINALGRNPNATPEQYVQAGAPQIGNALSTIGRNKQLTQQEAIQQLAGVAQQALQLDPVDRRALAKQAVTAYAPAFEALNGSKPDPAQFDSLPDEQLEQALQRFVAFGQSASSGDTGPLETIMGPDGQAQLTTRRSAIGQRPYQKPADAPNSYDEFIRAQRDPAFAKFLESRRGRGLSVTLPDGTTITDGPGTVAPGELSKPTINNLQETIVNATSRLDRINSTLSTYRPDFLRAKGIASATTTKVKDFLSMRVSPDQKAYLDQYSQFQSSATTDLAQFLKEMSGAAVTPQEYARTEKALPSGTELSPTEFEAKAKVAVKTISRAIMRANWALKNGIGVRSVEQLAKVMPLESIDQVYEERANAIWQELGGTQETRAQAIQRANQEFGVAR